jgi:hypothetical protein
MNARKTLLRGALAAAVMAAGSAAAQSNIGGIEQQGGVATPRSIEQPVFNQNIPSGVNAIPRADNPQNPNEARPFVQQPEGVRPLVRGGEAVYPAPVAPQAYGPAYGPAPAPYPAQGPRPMVRGDNPNLPNPVTPSAANESAPQPTLREPTNMTGMEGAPVGATR